MRKTTIAILIASTCLFAEDTPKQISQDFVKPGLKALIAVRNAAISPANMGAFPHSVQSVIDDAELEATTDADKSALALVRRLQFLRTIHAIQFYTLTIQHETELRGRVPYPGIDAVMEAAKDPAAIKNTEIAKACGDGIENILRSGILRPVPACDLPATPKEETKPAQVRKEEPKVEPKPVEATQVQTPAKRCYNPAITSKSDVRLARRLGIPACSPVGQ